MTISIAHRGEPVGHRENTIESFLAACALGADMVELDCRMTADGTVIVLHDPTLFRLWGRDAPARALSLAEVQCLGDPAMRIPTLEAALSALEVPIMVDVDDPAVMEPALEVVERCGAFERSLFAGRLEGLSWLRCERPAARIALSWDRRKLPDDELLGELGPEYFNPRVDLATEEAIAWMHARGIGVSTWTVDDERVMSWLVDHGVDAVITNQIATLVGLLERLDGAGAHGGAS